ncbi:MAG: hypothetical protein EOO77_01160 [Oxalobacteraceae bacterium]|nr:MAG: hypothetical protein EOO77_01160 [Oxalobacteraceae bacterium]
MCLKFDNNRGSPSRQLVVWPIGLTIDRYPDDGIHKDCPSVEGELADVDANGKPLFIVLDGLDEYDVGGATVSLAAGRLVEHVMTVMDEWRQYGHDVRLLLCGRPEAASSITRFRDPGTHLHVTGFVYELAANEEAANASSEKLMSVDQREAWWKKWQALCGEKPTGLPNVIASGGQEVAEITAQPLLNYMLAVLKLYGKDSLTNLSALYGSLKDTSKGRKRTNLAILKRFARRLTVSDE